MVEITLDNAIFEIHANCVLALNWYKHLAYKQAYIDSLGIHRAEIIHQFTIDAFWYIKEFDTNGFDVDTLTDLQQRISRKVHSHDSH